MSYVANNSSTTRAIVENMLGPVANSGRRALVAPLAVQHHLANFNAHVTQYIDAIVEGYRGASTSNVDNSALLRAALTRHILEVYYPELQKLAPLVSSPSNLGEVLESHAPMWEVEKGEDFPFFRAVHLPQLRELSENLRKTLDPVRLTHGLRFIPSYYTPDLLAFIKKEMSSRHSLQASSKRIKRLSETLGVAIADEELSHINITMSRVVGELEELATAHAITNLWELIVLADRSAADNDQPLFCGTDVHMRMMHSAYAVLPVNTAVSIPLSYVYNTDVDDEDAGIQRDDDVSDIAAGKAQLIGDIFEMMLIIAARTAKGKTIRINDITLPIAIHPIADTMDSIFTEGLRELLPTVKSEFLDHWLNLAKMGPKTPVKYDDLRVKLDTAMHVDKNAIPRAFDDHLYEICGTLPEALIKRYVDKRSVYTTIIETPIERTQLRITDTVDSIRESGRVRIESDQPFSFYPDKSLTKPAASDEGFLLLNKVDGGTVVDGEMASGVSAIVADLYKLKQPDLVTIDKEFTYKEFVSRLRFDQGKPRTLDLTSSGPTELRLSNVLTGASFTYRDDVMLFREHNFTQDMSMPRTLVRVKHESVIHEYANSAHAYGVISGVLANDMASRWARTVMLLSTRVARVYSAEGFAEVRNEARIVEQYQSSSYLKRVTKFDDWYAKMNIAFDEKVWRFLSAMQTQKMARDKIDLNILEKIKRHTLYVNAALLGDIHSYANSVSTSIIENFNVESEGFQLFANFVDGRLTDTQMGRMRDPQVITVFNSLMSVTFDSLEAKDTVITLILIAEIMRIITAKVK